MNHHNNYKNMIFCASNSISYSSKIHENGTLAVGPDPLEPGHDSLPKALQGRVFIDSTSFFIDFGLMFNDFRLICFYSPHPKCGILVFLGHLQPSSPSRPPALSHHMYVNI